MAVSKTPSFSGRPISGYLQTLFCLVLGKE
jgi:hypothetical protein